MCGKDLFTPLLLVLCKCLHIETGLSLSVEKHIYVWVHNNVFISVGFGKFDFFCSAAHSFITAGSCKNAAGLTQSKLYKLKYCLAKIQH